jgi:branched-chain amino acid transport system substrate-binding protein
MQVIEQAITATNTLDDDKLARYIHENKFDTIVGPIEFDKLGEWKTPRVLLVQFQNVQGSGLEQYLTGHRQVILYPPQYKDGELQQPFGK